MSNPTDQYVDIIFACQVQQILETETEFETIVYTLNDEQLKVGLCTDVEMGLVQWPDCGYEFACEIASVEVPASLEGALSWEGSSLFIESSDYAHVGTHTIVVSMQGNFDGEKLQGTQVIAGPDYSLTIFIKGSCA